MIRTATPQSAAIKNRVRSLENADLGDLADILRDDFATRHWIRRGCPRADIEAMEASNVMSGLANSLQYKKERDKLLATYDVTEFQLVCAGLDRIAKQEEVRMAEEKAKAKAEAGQRANRR